jgi:hypothetical protein
MSAQNNKHVSSFSLPAEGPFAINAVFPQILNPFKKILNHGRMTCVASSLCKGVGPQPGYLE